MTSIFASSAVRTAASPSTIVRVEKFVDLLDRRVHSRPFAILCPDTAPQRQAAQLWLFQDFGSLRELLPAAPSPMKEAQATPEMLVGNRIRAAGWVTYKRYSPDGATPTRLPSVHFHVAQPQDVMRITFAVSPEHFAGSAAYRPESPSHATYTGQSALDALALIFMSRGSSPAPLTPSSVDLAHHDLYDTGSLVFKTGHNPDGPNAFANLHFSGTRVRSLY